MSSSLGPRPNTSSNRGCVSRRWHGLNEAVFQGGHILCSARGRVFTVWAELELKEKLGPVLQNVWETGRA